MAITPYKPTCCPALLRLRECRTFAVKKKKKKLKKSTLTEVLKLKKELHVFTGFNKTKLNGSQSCGPDWRLAEKFDFVNNSKVVASAINHPSLEKGTQWSTGPLCVATTDWKLNPAFLNNRCPNVTPFCYSVRVHVFVWGGRTGFLKVQWHLKA